MACGDTAQTACYMVLTTEQHQQLVTDVVSGIAGWETAATSVTDPDVPNTVYAIDAVSKLLFCGILFVVFALGAIKGGQR